MISTNDLKRALARAPDLAVLTDLQAAAIFSPMSGAGMSIAYNANGFTITRANGRSYTVVNSGSTVTITSGESNPAQAVLTLDSQGRLTGATGNFDWVGTAPAPAPTPSPVPAPTPSPTPSPAPAPSPSGPSISGTVWTPNRVSGAVLAADWTGLPTMTPLEVAGSVMSSVIETPHLVNSSSADSSYGITVPWSGGAHNYITGELLVTGGGHGDSSALETGVYGLSINTLAWRRAVARAPSSALQTWNFTTNVMDSGVEHFNASNAPLANGVPAAIHTYNGLAIVPASVMGNTSGGLFYGGNARSLIDLDTGAYSTTHWNSPTSGIPDSGWDFSNMIGLYDSGAVWFPMSYWYWRKFDLTATSSTSWSGTSRGAWTTTASHLTYPWRQGDKLLGCSRQRREVFSLSSALGSAWLRMRYGQAIDASASDWTPYIDVITLTSSDGSHADFTASNLSEVVSGGTSKFKDAACVYDADLDCYWVWGNNVGDLLYKISGLNTNTWTTQKFTGTGALYASSPHGTYGRCMIERPNGAKVLVRVSSTVDPAQIIRLS